MSIIEVYEKHKHLDEVLSDPQFCEGSAMAHVARELWLAVKEHAEQSVQLTGGTLPDLRALSQPEDLSGLEADTTPPTSN